MFGQRTAEDANRELRAMVAERDARLYRTDPVVEFWRTSHSEYDADAARFQADRAAEDRRRTAEHEKRQREQADFEQQRQRALGQQFNTLCADILALRSQIANARATIAEGDPATAALAVGEKAIADQRLVPAERALVEFQRSNSGLRLHGMSPEQQVDHWLRQHTRQR